MEIAMADQEIDLTLLFSENDFDALLNIRAAGQFDNEAEAISQALRILRMLQEQFDDGYTDVVVRDPESKRERRLRVRPRKY
jgi:hypothetical protein